MRRKTIQLIKNKKDLFDVKKYNELVDAFEKGFKEGRKSLKHPLEKERL